MRNTYYKVALLAIFGITLNSCNNSENLESSNQATDKQNTAAFEKGDYIVTLKDGTLKHRSLRQRFSPENAKSTYLNSIKHVNLEVSKEFDNLNLKQEDISASFGYAMNGFVANLNKEQYDALKNDPRVESIEKDYIITLDDYQIVQDEKDSNEKTVIAARQSTPWGIRRVGGPRRSGRTAWIVDTGIDLDHRDLNVDRRRSISFIRSERSADDGNGHGTHVAGTVGALNNRIGVVGVAPGAKLIAVKVLDRRGSGSFSGIIRSLDYIAARGRSGDVVNMSLGPRNRYTNSSLDRATRKVASRGIKVAIAAGNSSDDCSYYSPARVNHRNVYTVSNMTSSGRLARSSNYGSPVDYAAPGTSIRSTWKGGGYRTISGTSMASPHVAGLLISGGVRGKGRIKGDKDRRPDPIAHRR